MKLIEAATLMACARLRDRFRKTIRNVDLAIAYGLCDKEGAVKFCHSLGLYAYGAKGHTDLKLMLEHIKRTGQSS